MDSNTQFMVYGIAAIVSLVIHLIISGMVARAAMRKGRSYAAFFWLSFFFSWIIMSIIVATMQPISSAQYTTGSDTRKCPRCAEWISTEATLCKHCRSEVVPIANDGHIGEEPSEDDEYTYVMTEQEAISLEKSGRKRAIISYVLGGLFALIIAVELLGQQLKVVDTIFSLALVAAFFLYGYLSRKKTRRK